MFKGIIRLRFQKLMYLRDALTETYNRFKYENCKYFWIKDFIDIQLPKTFTYKSVQSFFERYPISIGD